MSKPDPTIPISQLLSQNTQSQRLTSIRSATQQPQKFSFAPNIQRKKLKVKTEKVPIKKTNLATERQFKRRPALHGEGGLGMTTYTEADLDIGIPKGKKKLETNPELDLDPCNPYHPITLPLNDPRGEDKVVEQALDEKTTYYTPLETLQDIPEDIKNPLQTDSGLLFDEYVVMQIPSVLPIESNDNETKQDDTNKETKQESKDKKIMNPLSNMSGRLGTIQFRKSGIATMKIGGVTFQLTKVYRLGGISQHIVMTPQLDECFNMM
ncbi:RNA polymerase III RPC4 [Entamoeba marina]